MLPASLKSLETSLLALMPWLQAQKILLESHSLRTCQAGNLDRSLSPRRGGLGSAWSPDGDSSTLGSGISAEPATLHNLELYEFYNLLLLIHAGFQ